MRTRPLCFGEYGYVERLLGCMILVTIFTISGCANKGNLIPSGNEEMFADSYKGKKIADLDYPLNYAADPALDPIDASQITIRWTKNGEIIWTKPFWNKITWWRFALIDQGAPVGTPALCYTQWAEAPSQEITEVPCKFKVMNYLAMPLIGMLDFRFGGDDKNPPGENEVHDGVARLYFIGKK